MLTLLVVDDHASVLQTLDYALSSEPVRVLTAGGGSAALAVCEQERPEAALVDLHMPGMDGLTLTRALKDHAAKVGRGLPVWVMTAAPTVAAVEQARLAGAEALLKKPFDCGVFREELLRRLTVGPVPGSVAA